MWERDLLLWVHAHSTPFVDRMFLLTEPLGKTWFLALLTTVALAWHLFRHERREACVWAVVGVCIYGVKELLKASIARERPALWPTLIIEPGYAFPSGHALGTAAFYPLFAWTVFGHWTKRRWYWMLGALLAVFMVGLGRLYLGLHWPTDVIGGWMIGFRRCGDCDCVVTEGPSENA